jgi:hypothetical protein
MSAVTLGDALKAAGRGNCNPNCNHIEFQKSPHASLHLRATPWNTVGGQKDQRCCSTSEALRGNCRELDVNEQRRGP